MILPLEKQVSFKAAFQKGRRFQIPRLIRWQFKMEPEQVLHVTVDGDKFYAKMSKDGRITIPKILLEEDEKSLVGQILDVELKPCS
jgi:bifunctional DNA-binding transcriptional regulator/antitoxin component of YhaV-PrlF toxin-antitoxin module